MRRPLCVACILYILGLLFLLTFHPPQPPDFGDAVGKDVLLYGRIYAKEIQMGDSPILVLSVKSKEIQNQNQIISMKTNFICQLEVSEEESAKIGDFVCVQGKLNLFERATNPGQFDAWEYYAQKNIYGKLSHAKVVSSKKKCDKISEALYHGKIYLTKRLNHTFLSEDAMVLKAILLGDKKGMDEDLKNLYKDAGILHILAISGLHISMFAGALFQILKRSGMRIGINTLICTLLLVAYGILVGMPISAMRAIIMFLMGLYAKAIHRSADRPTSLLLAAVLILILYPRAIFSAAFLLSFGAVAGIELVKPALKREEDGMLADSFCTSLSVSLFLLPMQLYFYYEINLAGVFFNLSVIPLMSVLLFLGILSFLPLYMLPGIGSVADDFVGRILSSGVHGILQAYKSGCEFTGKLRGTWLVGRPTMGQIVVFYLLLGIFLFLKKADGKDKKKAAKRSRIGTVCLLAGILFVAVPRPAFLQSLKVTFLDVGQGDCTILEFPKGGCIVCDCGSSSVQSVGQYRLKPYLKSRGIKRVDKLLLSHGDLDHINGATELLTDADFYIGEIFLPITYVWNKEAFSEIFSLAKERKIPIKTMKAGDGFTFHRANFYCLNPTVGCGDGDNENSLAFFVAYQNFELLLMADIEGAGEDGARALLQKIKAREDSLDKICVLKVAHHGSRYTTSENFLRVATPDLAVISCGKNNRYGHPHKETLDRLQKMGCEIESTIDSGAVILRINGKDVNVFRVIQRKN